MQMGSLIVDIEIYGDGQKLGSISTTTIPILRKRRETSSRLSLEWWGYSLGSKQSLMDHWEKVLVELPSERLILPLKEPRLFSMPARIEGLAIVREKRDSKSSLFISAIVQFLVDSLHPSHAWSLPLSTVHSSKDRSVGHLGCDLWICDPFSASWNTTGCHRDDSRCSSCFRCW